MLASSLASASTSVPSASSGMVTTSAPAPRKQATAPDQVENRQLPVRERVQPAWGVLLARGALEQRLGDPGAHMDLSGQHLPDGADQAVDRGVLHDVAARAGAQRALGEQHFVVHRHHECLQSLDGLAHSADQVHARALQQGEVDQHEVGPQPDRQIESFGGRRRFAADLQVVLTTEHLADTQAHDRMMVHHQHPPDVTGRGAHHSTPICGAGRTVQVTSVPPPADDSMVNRPPIEWAR